MTKHIILFFAALCSLHNHANAAPSDSDTVRYESFSNGIEMLRPMQPSYLDGVVVPTRKSGNWFVSLSGGASAFLGTPLGCEDLFGRLKPSYTIGVGKWFTPSVGVRVNYSGLQFKDSQLSTQEYHHVHADLMWNLLGNRYAKQDEVRWGLSPYAGLGLLHNADNGHNPLAISYGIQGQYRISRRVSVLMELSGTTTFQDFDGYGKANRLGDHMLSLMAGFSFSIGKVGWKRAVDHRPYERRNEWLTGYANALTERNRQYAGKLDKERRTLDELKKILEIEGLLDTYGHLFDDKDDDGRKFPVNNYSGLNSLRARLKNRHWDGNSPLVTETGTDSIQGVNTDSLPGKRNAAINRPDTVSAAAYFALMRHGDECIGSPVYFFFDLNSARLTDSLQKVNLDAIAHVAMKYGLSVKVTGAADSATGTASINNTLSTARADYIAGELIKRGLPAESITRIYEGGIADYVPDEANRHTKVELHFR
ncbi:OmpA family protein [uncultured Bacteroides sp.]|uniref:OmpA family protein n=1 Tax=uncultured Bacteroides sp. TaxID=162156 RepID=UPI002635E582|nr:OmpA family protein [uncultured Bacteroides sp.]